MLPQSQSEEPRNSSRINMLISVVFHAVIVVALIFLAARQGLLGHQLRKISVQMIKEKPPEKPKEQEKPKQDQPPKTETPKQEPKLAAAPKVEAPKPAEAAAPPPAALAPPTVAPPAAELPSLDFDGGHTVQSTSDPALLYKSSLEYAFRSKWNRPENTADDNYVAEVEISVDQSGEISQPVFKKTSGDAQWDSSVKAAVVAVRTIGRAPPSDFPARVVVRFDVADTEPISQ